MATIENMTAGQLAYETKRANKAGLSLEDWLKAKQPNQTPSNDNSKEVYHYTKGMKLDSIIADGFIDLESTVSCFSKDEERFVWFTSSRKVPKGIFPMSFSSSFSDFEYHIDANLIGGIYRFVVATDNENIVHWLKRKTSLNISSKFNAVFNMAGKMIGYDSKKSFVSDSPVPLSDVLRLEQLDLDGGVIRTIYFDELAAA